MLTRLVQISYFCLFIAILLSGCSSPNPKQEVPGIKFISSRGDRPSAQSIVWSPIDENKVLIRADETPLQPAEVFIFDIQTGKKESVSGPLVSAQFIDAKWMPDGRKAIILTVDTKDFKPSGWWEVDINNKSAEYLLGPMDAVAWSPDGKNIAVLYRKPENKNNSSTIDLKLIDTDTKVEQIITKYEEVDYSAGLSWSPDSRYAIFSLGKYQGSSNLFILDMETRKVIPITQSDQGEHPSWSPKGNIIAFEANKHLHLISLDGKCEIEIPNLEDVWSPTWSPDGEKLAYIGMDGIYYVELEQVFGRNIYQNLCE
jgi:Tol biopolymer transport system component